jgi:hypothetical protein
MFLRNTLLKWRKNELLFISGYHVTSLLSTQDSNFNFSGLISLLQGYSLVLICKGVLFSDFDRFISQNLHFGI